MTELYVISGPRKGKSFALEGDTVFVGRSPENQIQINDKSVSRRHLKILIKHGKHFFVDLNSTNGTFISGKPIEPGKEFPIEERVPVTVGDVTVCLGKPDEWDALAVEDSIDLSNGLKDTGVFDRAMTSPKNLELIYNVSNVLMQSLDINETMEKVLDGIFGLLPRIDRGVIILVESETGKLLNVISRHSDNGRKSVKNYSDTIVRRVIRECRALVMSDTQDAERTDQSASMEIMKVRSVMCVPLISRSKIRGVLYVDSVGKPFGFRKEDLSLLSALSGPAAIAIENAILYSDQERLVAERTKILQETQQKLKESEARFKGIFDHMSNGVIVFKSMEEGRDFVVLDLNNACRSLERMAEKEAVVGKSVGEAFPELEKTGLVDVMRKVWKNGAPENRSACLNEGERLIWWREYYVYKLPSDEIVTIFEDVTERKKAEEEQKTLQKQLVHSQKMESIGAFASGIAHNFRNILQAISGNTEYLEMTHRNEADVGELTRCIQESVERGVDLIVNLLHFSRRGEDYELTEMDLSDAAKSACEIIRKVFDRNIDITVELDEGLMIKGNQSLLTQVFLNLFTNARDAMPNGGKLIVKSGRELDFAVVTVEDTGIGMEAAVLEKIFDPFFTLKEVGKGTGLGLSTTHGIVQRHHGTIQVCSKPGVGTIFRLSLPIVEGDRAPTHDPERQLIYGKGEKILIVDDELPSLETLSALIRTLGYDTISVDKPADALRNYAKWSPELTIMDRNMPGMDGITCIKEILKVNPGARILIVSGYEEIGPDGIDENVRGLIKGYLTKPCSLQDLSTGIARALRRAPRH